MGLHCHLLTVAIQLSRAFQQRRSVKLSLFWVSEYSMWVRGGTSVDGCSDSGSGYYCYDFVGNKGATSTEYSTVGGYELSNKHYFLPYQVVCSSYSNCRSSCNMLAGCGWTDFITSEGDDEMDYCTSTAVQNWASSSGANIYTYTPEYCKAGYELTTFADAGTTCWPASQGTPIYNCDPCEVGEYVRSIFRKSIPPRAPLVRCLHNSFPHEAESTFFGCVANLPQDTTKASPTILLTGTSRASFAMPAGSPPPRRPRNAPAASRAPEASTNSGTRPARTPSAWRATPESTRP